MSQRVSSTCFVPPKMWSHVSYHFTPRVSSLDCADIRNHLKLSHTSGIYRHQNHGDAFPLGCVGNRPRMMKNRKTHTFLNPQSVHASSLGCVGTPSHKNSNRNNDTYSYRFSFLLRNCTCGLRVALFSEEKEIYSHLTLLKGPFGVARCIYITASTQKLQGDFQFPIFALNCFLIAHSALDIKAWSKILK